MSTRLFFVIKTFKKFLNLFIYLAVLGVATRALLQPRQGEATLKLHGLLIEMASLVAEQRLQSTQFSSCGVCQSLSRVRLFVTPPGSSVHGIPQARILEWIAIPFSRGSSRPRDEPGAPALQADALSSEPPGRPQRLRSVDSIVAAPGSRAHAQQLWHMGVGVPQHVGPSKTRNQTPVSCIGRRILCHWVTRETPKLCF